MPPQRAGLFTSSGMGADGLLAWAERTGRRQTAQPGRGALRFAFPLAQAASAHRLCEAGGAGGKIVLRVA